MLTIALSKGRILKETLPLLAHAGISLKDDPESSRKLIFDTTRDDVKVVIIRAADVPAYVNHGAADIGVAGKDVLMESDVSGLYEPLDLRIACCKLMVAGPVDGIRANGRLRIATKYITSARRYFAAKGEQVDIIKLYGSMELAPLVNLADCIVDLVDTGNTLKANGLMAYEHMADISSRLVVNKASMKMKHDVVKPFIELVSEAVKQRGHAS
ncbi:MAG: ATP phosphoribosyltransferase [Gammaproteobacteria bacterium]|nr:ATP phosphoribosyltransferase [Gammaproteobacteria bacterium]